MIDQKELITYAKYGLEKLINENKDALLAARHYGAETKTVNEIEESIKTFENKLEELSK